MTLNLGQTSISHMHLVTDHNQPIQVEKYYFVFERWQAAHNFDTYGGKQLLQYKGEPLFAELVILRLLEEQGYKGVWVDTYRNKFWQRLPHLSFPVSPDRKWLEVYNKIYQLKGGAKSGCFDVMAYRYNHFVFAELKRQKEDSIRPSQIEWLRAARQAGLENPTFLVAEWSIEPAPTP